MNVLVIVTLVALYGEAASMAIFNIIIMLLYSIVCKIMLFVVPLFILSLQECTYNDKI